VAPHRLVAAATEERLNIQRAIRTRRLRQPAIAKQLFDLKPYQVRQCNKRAARWRAERPAKKAPLNAGLLPHTHFLHADW
jgi:hypothetical protein